MSLAAFVLAGAVIVSRQPRNIVGWLLMVPGPVLPGTELTAARLAALATAVQPGSVAVWLRTGR